jgi:hypothetical protein
MEKAKRKTGVAVIGDVPWGSHFCLFYQTQEDLSDILVPYFKAGLENNEFCMWVTSEPLSAEDAKRALKRAVANLDDYVEKGQIEILDYSQWYTKSGEFNADKVMQGWVEKENQAANRGFDGLRLTGNTFWLEKEDWRAFAKYEARIDDVIGQYRMIAICSYSLDRCGASEVIDVVSNHELALIRRQGKWEIIQSAKRIRAAEALREAETRCRTLIEHIPALTYSVRLDGLGSTLYISPQVERIWGFSPQEWLADPTIWFRQLHPDDRERVLAEYAHCIASAEPLNTEYRILTRDGRVMWGHHEAIVVQDEAGQPSFTHGVVVDITERKRAEEALRESEAKFRKLAEASTGAILIHRGANFCYANPAAERIAGYTHQEFLAMSFYDIVHPDFRELVRQRGLARQRGEDLPLHYEFKIITKSGEERWVEITPTSIEFEGEPAVLAAVFDITERKRAEEAYRTLVDHSLQGLAILQDGRAVFANQAMAEISGYAVEEMLALSPEEVQAFVHPDDREIVWGYHQDRLQGKALPERYEFRAIRKDGSMRWLEIHASRIDYQGKPAVQAAYIDISERKRAEQELRHRLDFERLVANISSQFISVAEDDIRRSAGQVLQVIRQFAQADRTYVMLFSDDGKEIDDVYESCAKEIEPQVYRLKGSPVDAFPWMMERIREFQSIHIRRVADLPPEAGTEKERFQQGGVQSLVALPTVYGGRPTGILGFDWVREEKTCSEDVVALLKIVGETLANALQRKRAEQTLRESEERFRILFEQASESIVLIDGETGALVEFNDRAHENLGYTREEFAKLTIPDFEVIESADEVAKHIERIVREGADTFETKQATKDGEIRDILVSGRAVSIRGKRFVQSIWYDITERKRAEEALEASEERFRQAFENANVGMCLVNTEGRLIKVNSMMSEILGYGREELEGISVNDITHPEDRDVSPAFIRRAISGEIGHARLEKRYLHKDGHVVWGQVSSSLVRDTQGVPLYFISHVQDITERKRAEEALGESEERYRTLVETAPDVIYTLSLEDATIASLNPAFETITGWPRAEWLGKPFAAIVHPDDLPLATETFQKASRGETPPPYELRILAKSGEYLVGEFISTPQVEGGKVVGELGIARDITERKQAEEALQTSEKRFRALIEHSMDGIALLDEDGTIQYFPSPATAHILGYRVDELVGRSVFELVHPDDLQMATGLFEQLLEKLSGPLTVQLRYRHKDGSWRWLECVVSNLVGEPSLRAVVVNYRDITERKHAEEAIRKSEQRYAALFEHNPIETIVVDLEGKVTAFNLAKRTSGDRLPQIGDVMYRDYGGKHTTDMRRGLMECIRSGQSREYPEQEYGDRVLSIWIAPFPDGAIITCQDVTERKRAEKRFLAYQENLRFVASELSLAEEHERRRIATYLHDQVAQTLAFSKIKLGTLRGAVSEIPDIATVLDEIDELIERAIRDTRSLTFEISCPTLYEIGLEAAVEELCEEFQNKHKIAFDFDNDNKPKPLSTEVKILLFQTMRELLVNVVKHAQARKVKISMSRDRKSIWICVEDDGIGFDTSSIDSHSGEIPGYGLFSIRERLGYLGGHFEIQSQPNRGTCATVVAPLVEERGEEE